MNRQEKAWHWKVQESEASLSLVATQLLQVTDKTTQTAVDLAKQMSVSALLDSEWNTETQDTTSRGLSQRDRDEAQPVKPRGPSPPTPLGLAASSCIFLHCVTPKSAYLQLPAASFPI
jgi:hypothetical protein